jgi:adenylyltransferase/sulfurtransferase
VKVDAITTALVPANAISLLSPYDVILDCTDNVPTRYLLSDTAVLLGKPLVSGAAQRYEGQLCIYNLGPDGPCYRCLFPEPPSVETIGTCAQTGILSVVTGIIGNMQALETLKLVTGLHGMSIPIASHADPCLPYSDMVASLLLFSSLGSPRFRTAKLRKRNPTCPACGRVGQKLSTIETTDYVQFCGGQTPDWESQGLIARPDYRIPAMVHICNLITI